MIATNSAVSRIQMLSHDGISILIYPKKLELLENGIKQISSAEMHMIFIDGDGKAYANVHNTNGRFCASNRSVLKISSYIRLQIKNIYVEAIILLI